MTAAEWAAFVTWLDGAWSPPMDATAEVAYQAELADLDADVARAAARAACRGREHYRPSAVGIRACAMPERTVSLDAALALYGQARQRPDGRAWLLEQSPAVALFVDDAGWTALAYEQVDDPGHGGLVRERLRNLLDRAAATVARDPDGARGRLTAGRSGLRKLTMTLQHDTKGSHA